jgi:hypothetical protein
VGDVDVMERERGVFRVLFNIYTPYASLVEKIPETDSL